MKTLPKLDLNVTNKCNFRCTHCAFDSGIIKMKENSLKKIEEILKETKEFGGQRIDVTGGEPLIRSDLNEIIKIGKELGYRTELVTNGSLLTDKKIKEFSEFNLDAIAISLDGINFNTYNKIRKTDKKTYEKILNNIEKCVDYFYTKINTTVFNSNLKEIEEITKFAFEKGVNEHGLYYFTPIGRGNRSNESAVEPLKWLKYMRNNLTKYKSKIKISVEFPMIEKEFLDDNIGCIANNEKSHLQILPNGNAYPCAILASYNKPIANLNKTSINDIWNNKKLWSNYWKDISSLFKDFNGYCVNFNSFNLREYDFNKYKFVCPLRKYKLDDIMKNRKIYKSNNHSEVVLK